VQARFTTLFRLTRTSWPAMTLASSLILRTRLGVPLSIMVARVEPYRSDHRADGSISAGRQAPLVSNRLDDPHTPGFKRPLTCRACTWRGYSFQLNRESSSPFRITVPPLIPQEVSKNRYAAPLSH